MPGINWQRWVVIIGKCRRVKLAAYHYISVLCLCIYAAPVPSHRVNDGTVGVGESGHIV